MLVHVARLLQLFVCWHSSISKHSWPSPKNPALQTQENVPTSFTQVAFEWQLSRNLGISHSFISKSYKSRSCRFRFRIRKMRKLFPMNKKLKDLDVSIYKSQARQIIFDNSQHFLTIKYKKFSILTLFFNTASVLLNFFLHWASNVT